MQNTIVYSCLIIYYYVGFFYMNNKGEFSWEYISDVVRFHNHFQVVIGHLDTGIASWKTPIVHCASHPRHDFIQQGAGPVLCHHLSMSCI